MITFFESNNLSKTVKKEVLKLWNQEYPIQLNYKNELELDHYLEGLNDQSHVVIFNESNDTIGWYFDFIREEERWFAIILDSSSHKQGIGTRILNHAKRNNAVLNGWVIDTDQYKKASGERYQSPLEFYLKNGFKIQDEGRLEDDKISALRIRWVLEK